MVFGAVWLRPRPNRGSAGPRGPLAAGKQQSRRRPRPPPPAHWHGDLARSSLSQCHGIRIHPRFLARSHRQGQDRGARASTTVVHPQHHWQRSALFLFHFFAAAGTESDATPPSSRHWPQAQTLDPTPVSLHLRTAPASRSSSFSLEDGSRASTLAKIGQNWPHVGVSKTAAGRGRGVRTRVSRGSIMTQACMCACGREEGRTASRGDRDFIQSWVQLLDRGSGISFV
ncbi:hypothetical protein B0H15DRAFT_649784 [Mycena belliarum]|uniref:Uncharacterized protein n=1 Tax=Mycena belliarum TaxID=1033014 RepID=A0AAD6TPW0_9AGAR|nr:hypothetical protein B0H15DRAFT_649784 [Mycena belliae]